MLLVTLLLILAYFAHMMTFYFLVKWIPKIVTDMGYPPALAGSVLVWANVGSATGCLVLSLMTQKVGVRPLVIGAMICGAVAVAVFGLAVDIGTGASCIYPLLGRAQLGWRFLATDIDPASVAAARTDPMVHSAIDGSAN